MFLNESRARCAERCLRNYYCRYCLRGHGVRSLRSDKKLVWGQLAHAGLAAHYTDSNVNLELHLALRQAFPHWERLPADDKNYWIEEVEWLEKVVGRYADWARLEDNFHVEGVEQAGAVALNGEHAFVFRLDLLVRDDYGFRVIDHKTTLEDPTDPWFREKFDRGAGATQLWGYCYGAEKQSGQHVGGYSINVIRRVKSAGEAPDLTKSCPGCGRRKAKGCDSCRDSQTPGRIARAERPADRPFWRFDYSFTPDKRERFLESRIRIANKITEHQRRLEAGDPRAFPHNPSAFGCDPDLCWGTRPGQLVSEIHVPEEKYLTNPPDYVTVKQMTLEEAA